MQMMRKAAFCAAMMLTVATGAFAAEKITVGAIADPGYHAAMWAVMNGKVKDANVEVTVSLMPIPAMIQASMTKQYDIIPNGVLAIPQMKEAGIDPLVIGTMIRHIPGPDNHTTDLWVKNDSPIKSPKDLKGKKIAVTSLEAQDVVSRRAVLSEKYGMNASAIGGDFTWVEIPAAQFEAALEAGRVDAVAFSNVLAYKVDKSGKYRSVLQGAKDLLEMYGGPMPTVLEMGYKEKMASRPEAYLAAAKLLRQSAQYMLTHQDEVFADVAPKYDMTPDQLKGWFSSYATMPYALGPTDKAVFVKAWKSGEKLGVLGSAPTDVEPFMWDKAIKE
ncbi:ABC-type nitrate/sulfonate/bicarbonate transport system, substrate-binding protein [Xaviernesmea oryzae]|uniref:ABC-type nitrate/sulfonate/bicarbonate transport system, substrate-binding protein n=1 Tax=Xaviernesmea oryzae TaxID=464029 RepID=A0A1X7G1S9_9HYPH|nr:ABC transporter substrate-binding protein [Xaviernesmea oryzae]SMF62485.1 ABC-type nitrate/sulfonate/bicarbonate transport system, substrate-binding protein [Xaviernesmea oryzae]